MVGEGRSGEKGRKGEREIAEKTNTTSRRQEATRAVGRTRQEFILGFS
jgi:hypothetical protein